MVVQVAEAVYDFERLMVQELEVATSCWLAVVLASVCFDVLVQIG